MVLLLKRIWVFALISILLNTCDVLAVEGGKKSEPKSTASMEQLKAAESFSFNGKTSFYRDQLDYVNTHCSTTTYVYKTPFFKFDLPVGFEVKYFTRKGGYSDHAWIAVRDNPTQTLPDPCENDCVGRNFSAYLYVSAGTYDNGKYSSVPWPLRKTDVPDSLKPTELVKSRYFSEPVNIIRRPNLQVLTSTDGITVGVEGGVIKRRSEVLFSNGLSMSVFMVKDMPNEFVKRQDCLLDKIIETIRAR